jgi:hypothetical protein
MKFITSSISMAMFMAKDYDLKVHELTEEEFQALAYDAISHIGQEDIAELTNFAYNKQPLQLRVGDILLIAQKYRGELRFHCIQVMESDSPMLRSEEIYIDEEVY